MQRNLPAIKDIDLLVILDPLAPARLVVPWYTPHFFPVPVVVTDTTYAEGDGEEMVRGCRLRNGGPRSEIRGLRLQLRPLTSDL